MSPASSAVLRPAGAVAALLAELGPRAELHDVYDEVGALIYHDLSEDDAHEVPEITALLRRRSGPVLELAAGSGRLTLPLLALGRPVTALDASASMLRLLSARLAGVPARLRDRCDLVEADMTDFDLDRRFGAVVLGTTSVTLVDETGRAGLFRAVRRHLEPGGCLLVSTVDRYDDADEPGEVDTEITGAGGRRYRLVESWPAGADVRTVVIVPADDDGGPLPVAVTTVRSVPSGRLAEELAAAGLAVVARHDLHELGFSRRAVLLEAEVAA